MSRTFHLRNIFHIVNEELFTKQLKRNMCKILNILGKHGNDNSCSETFFIISKQSVFKIEFKNSIKDLRPLFRG